MNALWFNQLDFASLCKTSRLELAQAFSGMGHRLRVVGRFRKKRPRLAGIIPRPLLLKQHLPDPAGGIFFQLQAFLLAASAVLNKVDLILVDHYSALTMLPFNLLSTARLIRTKFVLDIRSSPVDTFGLRYALARSRYNLSIRSASFLYDGITVITDLYRTHISSRFRINPAKIGVWTSGVRTDVFNPRRVDTAHADTIKSRLGLGDSLIIMYHGVLSAYRGLQEVVRALALLRAEGCPETVWVILGDGPAAAQIAALAQAHGVTQSIRLLNSVPYEEVPDYLSICHAGILPYPDIKWLNMNSPLKLLEYMAMEKPLILTDIPAHRAIMRHAPCAFYISDNSPSSIARAIRNLADRKPFLTEIGKQARKIVQQNFTWESQVHNLLHYTAALGPRKDK